MEVANIPQEIKDKVFSCKSIEVYNKWHQKFIEFIKQQNLTESMESVLKFFDDLAPNYAPSSLWQGYSCLNKYYVTYKGWKSFNDAPFLKNYLKKFEKESAAKKKSMIFSKEQIFDFLNNAPGDDRRVLVRQAATAIGYYGGLRSAELVALEFDDVVLSDVEINVFIKASKNDPLGEEKFYFVITKKDCELAYSIVKRYAESIENKTGRFFRNFNNKANKFTKQPMGINMIAAIPKFIATYLKLENVDKYTGHCFRRSSATALANTGVSRMSLKRQFRWKSDTVAEGYVASSKSNKIDIAKSLTLSSNAQSTSNDQSGEASKILHIHNCSNVVINL